LVDHGDGRILWTLENGWYFIQALLFSLKKHNLELIKCVSKRHLFIQACVEAHFRTSFVIDVSKQIYTAEPADRWKSHVNPWTDNNKHHTEIEKLCIRSSGSTVTLVSYVLINLNILRLNLHNSLFTLIFNYFNTFL
jgi:hypothetical protein